jgi:hypothetical protein
VIIPNSARGRERNDDHDHTQCTGRGRPPRRRDPGSARGQRGIPAAAAVFAEVRRLCWATFTGYPITANWDLETDTAPLFVEALRVPALKSAVFELTGGDEHAAELLLSAPVDEMVHAILAQYTLCRTMTGKLEIQGGRRGHAQRREYIVGSGEWGAAGEGGQCPQPRWSSGNSRS